jgi:hypothetical protein
MNKVLHIWNTAGVASLMSKHLRSNGYISDVIMRTGYDPFGMAEYYGDELLDLAATPFIEAALKKAKDYDIIHVHGLYRILPRLRSLYPNKKIILQHHGTELSNCTDNKLRLDSYKCCDSIICSTNDLSEILIKEQVDHYLVENAVDTDLFKPIDCDKKDNALYIDIRYIDNVSVYEYLLYNCKWEYDVLDREVFSVKYSEMPKLLNKYSKYIDVKMYEWTNGVAGKAYSKTGREALACGLEVFNYNGEIVKGLPKEFTPEYQLKQLIKIYE